MFLLFLFCFICLHPSFSYAQEAHKKQASIFAVVNDTVITQQDLMYRAKFGLIMGGVTLTPHNITQAMPAVKDAIVFEAMARSLGERYKITPDAQEIESFVSSILQQQYSRETVEQIMSLHHIPREEIVRYVKAEVIWREYLKGRFPSYLRISDLEVQETAKRLKENKRYPGISEYVLQETFSFHQIVFSVPQEGSPQERQDTLLQAQELHVKHTTGKAFLEAVQQDDRVAVNTRHGIPSDHMPQELKKIFLQLKPGGMSPVLNTPIGPMVFVLVEHRSANQNISEERVRLALLQKKMESLNKRERYNLASESYVEFP